MFKIKVRVKAKKCTYIHISFDTDVIQESAIKVYCDINIVCICTKNTLFKKGSLKSYLIFTYMCKYEYIHIYACISIYI